MSKTPLDRVWYFLQQWDQGPVLAKAGHVPLNYDDVGSLAETVKASQADLSPLAELVTDEDVVAARAAGMAATDGVTASDPYSDGVDYEAVELRAALEAYGARLLARIGAADGSGTVTG